MKRIVMASVLLVLLGCSAAEVRCDRKLQPINLPANPVLPGPSAHGAETKLPRA